MAISTTAYLAGTAATFILLAVARRAAPMFRSNRRVVLGLDTIDTDAATATSGTVGYAAQKSRQTRVRQALRDHGSPVQRDLDQRVAAGPIDHHTQAQQRWVTDGGPSEGDRRWTL